MPKTDARIDKYIDKSQDFAKPILTHLRKVIHQACPQVEETLKWSMPHFDYKGEMMCSFASFKAHCAFGFWKGSLLKDPNDVLDKERTEAMGQFGRITSVKDLPDDKIIINLIHQAMKLNDEGIKLPVKKPSEKKELEVPAYLLDALKRKPAAKKTFDEFSYSNKKDYVEWISEAKTDATREKRMEEALEWMAEGKTRHWKYKKK